MIVVPTAALIWLFGNQYWVPNLSITLIIWFTFVLLLACLYRYYESSANFYLTASLIVLSLFVFATEEFGLLGEVPAAFLVIVSALLICHRYVPVPIRELLAGLALGVAINTKLIIVCRNDLGTDRDEGHGVRRNSWLVWH
jgi:hypothetical protein